MTAHQQEAVVKSSLPGSSLLGPPAKAAHHRRLAICAPYALNASFGCGVPLSLHLVGWDAAAMWQEVNAVSMLVSLTIIQIFVVPFADAASQPQTPGFAFASVACSKQACCLPRDC